MKNSPIPKPKLGEPYLLTPGPLTTSYEVKEAMLRDWGSWDDDFRAMTRDMRSRLLDLIGPGSDAYDCVPIQGSGSYCVEAMLGSFVPKDGKELADAAHAAGRKVLIDSMSAFGAIPLEAETVKYAAMVSSANKCIEGVPGFGFVIARTDELVAAKGNSHSLSLDVEAQWSAMEKTGQWRFTPPTHVVAAFIEALKGHKAEGGVAGRGGRYHRNRDTMVSGMRALGFETLLDDRWQSPIIVTFFCPADPKFSFKGFYEAMKEMGFIIYPGKLTVVDTFRVGCIGQMDDHVMHKVVKAAGDALTHMGVLSAVPPAAALEERKILTA